ncbi:MAG: bifunctional precorrin-2 dehydrogenase/sirohydrochlorin ferrochelatase [Dehalococcoidia bacterium]|nr:bifunctional precorrin-2 dehydrogenase/sirohydrochlorin ferrochelatase [Dehalococcoidia bacterium]
MRYYPVFLDLAGKPAVVIGGGKIAQQKVEGLLNAGAQVTVISPELSAPLSRLAAGGRFRHTRREYRPGDLEGYVLAFVATDDRSVNAVVAREGKERGVWVNAVDDPPNCDFIMPGVVERGPLVVAVSTSGTSPAMARKMREELQEFLTEEHVLMLELAAEVRAELRERGIQAPPDIWNAALDAELKRLLAGGRRAEARERLLRALLEPVSGV